MVEKSSGPNSQTDKQTALVLERKVKQLEAQLRLQNDQQAQKKRSVSPPTRHAKRAKMCNDDNYPPPHVPVGDNSMRSLGAPSPVCSSNARRYDNHQVTLSRNSFLSPPGRNIVTSSTRMSVRSRSCAAWNTLYVTAHNRLRQIERGLRDTSLQLDEQEKTNIVQVEHHERGSAFIEFKIQELLNVVQEKKNELQEAVQKIHEKTDEAKESTLNHDMSLDQLVDTRKQKAAISTDLIEAERTTEAMAWFYHTSFHQLDRSEQQTTKSSVLKCLNQAQLQEVFQTFSIEDFESMNLDELHRNYTGVLVRGGHEKKDSIMKVVQATKDQRKDLPYSKVDELKHILADIFGFDAVPHAPVANHH